MTQTAAALERDRYVVLRSLLKNPLLAELDEYVCSLADAGKMLRGDSLAPNTPSAYGDFMTDGMLARLLPEIEQASGLKLFPTYSYCRVYTHGDTLPRHTDRSACEISVSLCLGFDAERPWPIFVAGRHGVSSAELQPGDALLYRGIECPHWRDRFDGVRQAQVFLHYVDQHGPYTEWKFDKRAQSGWRGAGPL